MMNKHRILIAGIGGASLGTEILKCLTLAGTYEIYGCDISPLAFGHYDPSFKETFITNRGNYVESVLKICRAKSINCIIPGGEEPMVLLASAAEDLVNKGLVLASNTSQIIERFSNKKTSFEILSRLGFQIPLTLSVKDSDDLDNMNYPCIIKPATGSGGSNFVSLAENKEDASMYVDYLTKNGKNVIVQEYISEAEGEFTVGVLSLPNQRIVGSIALKRIFESKLSILSKGKLGLISTGYTQGLIDDFPEVCTTAEKIAKAIGSKGPINVQGRVKDDVLMPFEINPRFSASTYLRAMAGFNEIDIYLQYILDDVMPSTPTIKPGYYLRSLTETYAGKDGLKK